MYFIYTQNQILYVVSFGSILGNVLTTFYSTVSNKYEPKERKIITQFFKKIDVNYVNQTRRSNKVCERKNFVDKPKKRGNQILTELYVMNAIVVKWQQAFMYILTGYLLN